MGDIGASYRYDMSIEEAAELARRAIYHATFRDGASGGVASGTLFLKSKKKKFPQSFWFMYVCILLLMSLIFNQFITWDQMAGRSYLVMMLVNFTTNTIQ